MRLFLKLGVLGWMGFLDLSMGVFVFSLLSLAWGYPARWEYGLLAAALAAAPDIDLLWSGLRRFLAGGGASAAYHHEYITHRPLFGVTAAAALGYFWGGPFWSLTAGILLFWHYLHDTKGFGGGGIAWLWPFSRCYYGVSWLDRKIVKRSPAEAVQNGDMGDLAEGVLLYLRPSLHSLREVAASCFLWYVPGWIWFAPLGLLIPIFIWFGLRAFWGLAGAYYENPKAI